MTFGAKNEEMMHRLVDGLSTKSAKIRKLAEHGYARADIARFLGIRYQHVRNVLNQPLTGTSASGATPSDVSKAIGAREDAAAFGSENATEVLRVYRFHVDAEGRIKLPTETLKTLDAAPGAMITARYEDGELHLMNIDASVRFAQRLALPYIKEGEGNWSNQIIAERRAEAARDAERDDQ